MVAAKKVSVGNGALHAIEHSKISELKKLEFFSEARVILQRIIEKLQERSPLRFSLVRALSSLDPAFIVKDNATAVTKFKTVTKKLVEGDILTFETCDHAERQYRDFVDAELAEL